GVAQLSRAGRAVANAELGQHGAGRRRANPRRLVGVVFSRPGDPAGGDGHQPGRRLAARPAGPPPALPLARARTRAVSVPPHVTDSTKVQDPSSCHSSSARLGPGPTRLRSSSAPPHVSEPPEVQEPSWSTFVLCAEKARPSTYTGVKSSYGVT